ncbi:MAG TPA: hypothetical protein VN044_03940 [Verrucomicrobiae bacterium]|jgi:hypothetical protein|nr:hypothetical protein [Verrucomicrobiae bacterium]
MGMIGCEEFLDQLVPWMDGERHPGARAHLRDCKTCRGVVEDLEAICETAHSFATAEADPPVRIWTAVRAQLEQEGLIRSPRRGWIDSITQGLEGIPRVLSRPALAAAYLAVLIAVAFALGRPTDTQVNDNSWIRSTRSSTLPLSAQLDTAEEAMVSSLGGLSTLASASLHENLAIVDNYIDLCEKGVREDPQNEVARDYLYEAYRQKADLLAQMNERGDDGR